MDLTLQQGQKDNKSSVLDCRKAQKKKQSREEGQEEYVWEGCCNFKQGISKGLSEGVTL